MRVGKAILSFALAILWLGMPVHCELEIVSAASILACVDDGDCASAGDQDCEDDFCASLESGNYFPQKAYTLMKAGALLDAALTQSSEDLVSEIWDGSTLTVHPVSWLAGSWRSVERVAAPPRAPSVVS